MTHDQAIKRIALALQVFWGYDATHQMGLSGAIDVVRSIEPELRLIVDGCRLRDHDERWGNDIYGYSGDKAILTNLHYISDRWNAGMRITWMLGLIDRYYRRGY